MTFCGREPNCILDRKYKDSAIILLQLLNNPNKVSVYKASILKNNLILYSTSEKTENKDF